MIFLNSSQLFEMEVDTMAEAITGTLIEQGETRAKRAAVLKLLHARFGSVPETLATQKPCPA